MNTLYLRSNCTLLGSGQDPSRIYEQEIMWTNTLFSVSTTISYIHFLYWLQLHSSIGPVVISASQVMTSWFTMVRTSWFTMVRTSWFTLVHHLSSDRKCEIMTDIDRD